MPIIFWICIILFPIIEGFSYFPWMRKNWDLKGKGKCVKLNYVLNL